MQTQLILNLGPAVLPDFATGALINAILAWPTFAEAAHFNQVSEELMAGAIRITAPEVIGSITANWPQLNWHSITTRSRKKRPALGGLQKRLNQRMAAARAGIGMSYEKLFGTAAVLPPGMTALSINQLCQLISGDVSIDDPDNIEKLVWRRSLPILHLAMAVQLLLAARHGDRAASGVNLDDIDFYREAVILGAHFEDLVHEHPGIAITRDRMTLLRWYQ